MLNILFSWVNSWGALPLSAANVEIKPTERGDTFLYVTLRSFLRSRSEKEALLPWLAGFSCGFYLLFGCFMSVKNCPNLSKIWDLTLPQFWLLNLLHPLLLLLCYRDLLQPIPHATKRVSNQRSWEICPLCYRLWTLGFVCKHSKAERQLLVFSDPLLLVTRQCRRRREGALSHPWNGCILES